MDYRKQKQFIVGLSSLATLTLVIFGLTAAMGIFSPKVPQDFSRDNQGEAVFDDLTVVFSDIFAAKGEIDVGGDIYDAVAYVKNSNSEYGASNIEYKFIFLTENGERLQELSGKTYIFPQESKYIIEPALGLAQKPARIEFSIGEVSWRRLAPFSPEGLKLKDASLNIEERMTRSRFSGIVDNESPFNLKNVEVHVVLYREGRAVAVGRTDMQDLLRNTARAFQVVWPYALSGDITVDARLQSNFFENSNFIRDYAL